MPFAHSWNFESFPARDETLGALIRQLSDPESGPPADNLITNEDSFPRVVGELRERAPGGGVYLGVGPDQNFTYIAEGRPERAFVLDYRRRNLLLHLLHKGMFMLSPDRVTYLSRLTARRPSELPDDATAEDLVEAFERAEFDRDRLKATVEEVVKLLRPLNVVAENEWADLATIQARLAGPGMNARFLALPTYPTFGALIQTTDRTGRPAHLLAREESYQALRQTQQEDRILPLVGDFASPTVLPRLARWLEGRGLSVSIFYISDVEFFLLRAGRFDDYVANLGQLPWADGALLIRSSTREIDHPDRVEGDIGTTILRPVAPFLEAARAGHIRSDDDLFNH
ncbi:hypothetical protein BH23PLA1_BH23PLA1_11330 [soil metagenome]